MARQISAVDHVPAPNQQEQKPYHHEDRAYREPGRQDIRLGARLIVRTAPTDPPDQEHPSRPETDEAARNRKLARVLRREPPPHEQTREQRDGVEQVGEGEQPSNHETNRQWPSWLHLSDLRLATVGPSMGVGASTVNASRDRHYGKMVDKHRPLISRAW
jgi:hypothetical protein